MFSAEYGAMPIINEAMDKYEKQFKKGFPLYEYANTEENHSYDFSIETAHRIEKIIKDCLQNNVPVVTPEGYNNRIY